ncbi:MAG: ORF6N domain-containing protein [Dehalococcoidia bacterium]|nr:ORF6N domain-containing protein [Dehalococcoidia bacterium]
MAHESEGLVVPLQRIEQAIIRMRGLNVMLDEDLAALYGVETRMLVQAVKRNIDRFPSDFMYQLTQEELGILKSQSVISRQWGGRRSLPYVFTEQGVAMLSGVLRSARAVQVNVEIMRAFVRLRSLLGSNKELLQRLDEMERRYDAQFQAVFEAIRELMRSPETPQRRIGFVRDD